MFTITLTITLARHNNINILRKQDISNTLYHWVASVSGKKLPNFWLFLLICLTVHVPYF